MRTIGRYEIVGEIGRGGTSIVHKARDIHLDHHVALKELAGPARLDAVARERFVRSARLATTFAHRNVVAVREVFDIDGTPYVAMEYLERGSLRRWLRDLTPSQFAGVFEDALAGLAYVASRGVVHRDLKPENLLVSGAGRVKIADFAIAKSVTETRGSEAVTPVGSVVGTPSYMAPEQATAGEVGPWTDLYALGCIAYEVLSGHVPFDNRESPMTMLLERVSKPVPHVVSLVPFVLRDFSNWVSRLLATDPADRPESPESAWRELETIIVELDGPRWRDSSALPPLPATPRPSVLFETGSLCPTCGGFNSLREDFCSRCGSDLREPTGAVAAVPPPPASPTPAGHREASGVYESDVPFDASVGAPEADLSATPQRSAGGKLRRWRRRFRRKTDHAAKLEPASDSTARLRPPMGRAAPHRRGDRVRDPSQELWSAEPRTSTSRARHHCRGGQLFEVSVYADSPRTRG